MQPTPRFAVLLCTHNGEAFIEAQLNSLLHQHRPPDLLLIHDWASTDRTQQICATFAENHQRQMAVEIFRHSDAPGPQVSFARAIDASLDRNDFDYLFLCDQDDTWHPDKLQVYEDAMGKRCSPAIIFSDAYLIDAAGKTIATSLYAPHSPFAVPTSQLDESLLFANPVVGMTMAIERHFLVEVREVLHWPWMMHDWGILLTGLCKGAPFLYVPRALASYRQHGANQLGAASRGRIIDRLRKIRQHFAKLKLQIELVRRYQQSLGPVACPAVVRIPENRLSMAGKLLSSRSMKTKERMLASAAVLIFW